MKRWVPFVLFMSGVSGVGYGLGQNAMSPLNDRWAAPKIKARVHSYAAMLDSLGFAIGSSGWGFVFDAGFTNCIEIDKGINPDGSTFDIDCEEEDCEEICDGTNELIWYCAAGAAFFTFVCSSLLYYTIFKSAERNEAARKKHDELEKEHHLEQKALSYEGQVGTEEDYLKLGALIGKMLQNKGFRWISNMSYVERSLDRILPVLNKKETIQGKMRDVDTLRRLGDLAQELYRRNETEGDAITDMMRNLNAGRLQ